jgi:hypothetical protein
MDVRNNNWNLPRVLTTISRKIICDIWCVGEKASGTKSSFSSISLHAAGFSKIDESWDLRDENTILDRKLYFRMFCQGISFVSFGFEWSSFSLPESVFSDEDLEFGDVTWNFLTKIRLFCSASSSGRARTLSLHSIPLHSSFYWGSIRSVQATLNGWVPEVRLILWSKKNTKRQWIHWRTDKKMQNSFDVILSSWKMRWRVNITR